MTVYDKQVTKLDERRHLRSSGDSLWGTGGPPCFTRLWIRIKNFYLYIADVVVAFKKAN